MKPKQTIKKSDFNNLNSAMHLDFKDNDNLKATRHGFGEALELLGKYDKLSNVYAVCADLTGSVKMDKFKAAKPKNFVQVGVAEQNLVTVASGIAATKKTKIVFASSYAAFMPGRCYEQIRTTIAYNDQNVKLVGAHAGIATGPDGATHQMLEDISMMRALPNMIVVVPSDYNQAKAATIAIAKYQGPAYLRISMPNTQQFTTSKTPFKIGKANILTKGDDLTIIACGILVIEALKAAKTLQESHNIKVQVIDCHTIKPLDKKTILNAAKNTKKIITLEEHQINGGLGGAVAEVLAENSENTPTKLKRLGINDCFGESGEPLELLNHYKLTSKHIVKEALKLCK
jgi:transketolase